MQRPRMNGFVSSRPSRRSFFEQVGSGLCGAALASVLSDDLFGRSLQAAEQTHPQNAALRQFDLRPKPTHFHPPARSVIQLFMNGGPSQMDLFDPKEELEKKHGMSYFGEIAGAVITKAASPALWIPTRGRCERTALFGRRRR